MINLKGKIALITGTGGGLGREAALRFAEQGATVIGCDINNEAQEQTRKLMEAHGYELHGSGNIDLSDPSQAKAWVTTAASQFGQVHILFNNASAARFAPIEDLSVEDWYFTTRNELDLVFFTTKFAWPHLKGDGVVINMGSTAAWCGSTTAGKTAHSATKGAVVALTRQLAAEGAGVGIRAVSISPGFIKTPGTASFIDNPQIKQKLLDGVLLNRPGEPEDIIGMALFLASDAGSFITGSDIVIDGGMLAT
ncbi:SDR family oxidoreductase [Aestuariicella hydrocarbonica]|uniref:SDR family oxidoreductase n=1 Tax=Pseudomaricurvus hydrocarbonicus TaxID=1470433 RepID=A0A9E5JY04_9GAMM|nr:SDR family NAD(P)-dependent oxidoreductase [Aestuariicella hydrocarbonica]NHO66701.1 SDR family oxidoreductase [Aestuariicella hydrocarbonica]